MAISDLFNNIGGGFASADAGFQSGVQQNQSVLQNLLTATQVARGATDNQFDDANLPTRIAQAQANLAATQGQNTTRDLSNTATAAEQPSSILANISNNQQVPQTNMIKSMTGKDQANATLAAHLMTMTPVQREATLSGLAQRYGDAFTSDPDIAQIRDDPAGYLQGAITAARLAPKNILEQDKDAALTSRAVQVAGMNNQSREDIANARIAAAAKLASDKKNAAMTLEGAAMKGSENAASMALTLGLQTNDPDMKEYYANAYKLYHNQKVEVVAAGKPDTPQIGQGGIVYAPAPTRQADPVFPSKNAYNPADATSNPQIATRTGDSGPPSRAPGVQKQMDQDNIDSLYASAKATTDPDQQNSFVAAAKQAQARFDAKYGTGGGQDNGAATAPNTGTTSTGLNYRIIQH